MALIDNRFVSGFRLINGDDLNRWIIDKINAVFNGSATGTAVSVTGNLSAAYVDVSTGTGLTAVGTNRATSLALTKAVNVISTAAASTGVTLPSAATVGIGGKVVVFNNGANPIKVYGDGSDTIDGTAGATGVTLTNALRCEFYVTAALTYISAQLGAVSA